MNIILSCYSVRGRGSYCIAKEGKTISEEVFNIGLEDKIMLKEYILYTILKGLREARSIVSHDDILLVEIQNRHVAEWLNGQSENKDYSKYLDDIYSLIETMDCRFRFANLKPVRAINVFNNKIPVKLDETLSGINSVFAELEGGRDEEN